MANHKKKKIQNFKILHLNTQGVRNKFTEIKALVKKYRPAIIILNECKIDFDKQRYDINGYDKLTHTLERHLATAMYIQRGLRWTETEVTPGWTDENKKIEGVGIKLFTNHATGHYIKIKGIYIQIPNQHHAREELEETLADERSIIIGDMNLRMHSLGHKRNVGLGNIIKKAIKDGICTLKHANAPSRPTSQGNTILDLAIITHQQLEAQAKQVESVGSDHLPWLLTVRIEHNIEDHLSRNTKNLYEHEELRDAYQQTMWEGFRDLNEDLTTEADCEKYVETMEKAIVTALDTHAPLKRATRQELLPQEINEKIDLRNKLKQIKWQARHCSLELQFETRALYNHAKKEAEKALKKYSEKGWLDKLKDPRDNRSQIWKIQRSMKKPIPKLPNITGCSTERETIDSLTDTAIVKEAKIAKEDEGTEKMTPFQQLDPTCESEVQRALSKFKNKKAPGPDGIKADALKLGGEVFTQAYVPLANFVLSTGYFPNRWKTGVCIFLHKTGKDHRQASSYRPITLLNIMGKLCERLILTRLTATVDRLQPSFQHGFTRARGTATQILRTGKIITDALAAGDSVSMISTDLSKAFDSINHKGLINKLQNKDVPNNVIKIIENYLTGRNLKGRFRTTETDDKPIPHGVPQGSILGPVIFNLYVHDIWDIHDHIRGLKLSQYADDLCILNRATNPDHATMRAEWAAAAIIDFYTRWGLKCNIDKTECIMFSKKKKYRPTVKLKQQTLHYQKQIRYLGVIFDKHMKMNQHTEKVVKKLKQIRGALGPIIGYYAKTELETKLAIIQTCILPLLDYGVVQLLSRYSATNLCKIERQYRMALKSAAQLPRRTPTETIWEMADIEAWHLRAEDLNTKMLENVARLQIEDLETPGDAYKAHGEFNPLRVNCRIGEILYDPNKKVHRRWPIDKTKTPRPLRIS
jgi:hypothetical protein